MKTLIRIAIVAALLTAAGCSSDSSPDQLVLLTHDSFALSEGTLEAFTDETGIDVVLQTAGDAGTMLNQAILTKDNPIADVIYGIDNTFLSRAVSEELFVPYASSSISAVGPELRVDGDIVTPIDFGDVCLNYDIEALDAAGTAPPSSLIELTMPDFADALVVQNPATSSPGLAFLLATIDAFPEGSDYDWRAYWADLFDNGVAVAADWSAAYYTEFTRSGGTRPIVVSYASSPPVEVLFGELETAPTGVVTDGCFRQIEYAGILRGTANEDAAGELIDHLLSVPVQEDIPLNMFVYPANEGAELPQLMIDFTTFPESPTTMDPDVIEENRERWIEEWTEIARS